MTGKQHSAPAAAAAPQEVKAKAAPPTPPPGLSPNQLLAWSSAQVQPPDTSTSEPLPPPLKPPTGDPDETATTQWAVKATDTDIALTSAPTSVVVGSVFLIDAEYMTVASLASPDNPAVVRGAYNTVPAVHDAGVDVGIWIMDTPPAAQTAKAGAQSTKAGKNEPRFETDQEEATRERKEERREEDRR